MDWTAFWKWEGWNGVAAIGQAIGAIGTMLAVVIALIQTKEASAIRVKVRANYGYIASEIEISPTLLTFSATNLTQRPVTLVSAGVMLPNGKRASYPDEQAGAIPKKLEESETAEFNIEARKLARQLNSQGYKGIVKVRLFFSDSTGRRHWYKFKFSVDSFLDDKGEVKPLRTMI